MQGDFASSCASITPFILAMLHQSQVPAMLCLRHTICVYQSVYTTGVAAEADVHSYAAFLVPRHQQGVQ